ncbi:MAG: RHS repeat domain-containing protein [Bacteroidota bacterium]
MKKLLILLGLLTSVSGLWAQQTQSIFKEASVIPPSPEATAMNQFIDLPVGHYTGIPNVSVPIYTLQLPQLSLPISLNYHAGGLKVGEHSSWVGAGWSLSAGGSVNRTVRGLADEFYGTVHRDGIKEITCDRTGYGYQRLDTAFFESDLSGISQEYIRNLHYQTGFDRTVKTVVDPITGQEYSHPVIYNYEKEECPADTIDYFDEGIYDSEPDLYHFSFPGGSGKFTYNRARQLVKISADDVDFEVSPIDNIPSTGYQVVDFSNSSFRLKDAAGIEYTFAATEKTNTFSMCVGILATGNRDGVDPNMAHISNWKLTKIKKDDNWINFEYETDTIIYEDNYNSGSYVIAGTGGAENGLQFCKSERTVHTQRLTRIVTSNGYEVLFDTGGDRLDLEGDERLSDIRIEKSGALIAHYELDNDQYFGLNDKLKLNGVKQLSTTNAAESLPGYSFTYYTGPSGFPYIGSYSQDYWGYFNGANNGDTITGNMIPYYHVGNMVHANRNTHVNRDPSLEHTQTGTLSKITYPTGGHTEFTYELNRFYDPVYQKIHTIQFDTVPDYNTTEYSASFEVLAQGDVEILSHGVSLDKHSWTLEKSTGASSWTEVRNQTESGDFLLEAGTYQFVLTNYSNAPGEEEDDIIIDPADSGSGSTGTTGNISNGGGTNSATNGLGERVTFRIVSKFDQEVTNEVSGGLRIRKMQFYDPLDTATQDKYFVYEEENGNSSGRQFTKAWVTGLTMSYMPGTVTELELDCADAPLNYRETISLSHSSTAPVATYQGSHIGYGSVYEITYTDDCVGVNPVGVGDDFPTCGILGVSHHQFHNYWTEQSSSLIPATDHSYKNGVKELDIQYKYDDQSFTWRDNLVKLSETSYQYEEVDEGYHAMGVLVKETANSFCYQWERGSKLQEEDVLIVDYDLKTKWYRSIGQTTTQYDENGEYPLTTVSNVYYDPAVTHHFPTSSEVTESTGAVLLTEQVRDATDPALMVQQEVFRKEDASADFQQISGEKVSYDGVLPSSYQVWNRERNDPTSGGYEAVKEYSYGTGSLLKEARDRPSLSHDGRVAYLWSYGKQHVVAQISNISSTELEAALGQVSVVDGQFISTYNFDGLANEMNHTYIEQVLDQLRTILGGNNHQQMTTYLYGSRFGLTSIIDPNGRKTSYVYDDFGRLMQVKDHDGNVLSETEYNYSND